MNFFSNGIKVLGVLWLAVVIILSSSGFEMSQHHCSVSGKTAYDITIPFANTTKNIGYHACLSGQKKQSEKNHASCTNCYHEPIRESKDATCCSSQSTFAQLNLKYLTTPLQELESAKVIVVHNTISQTTLQAITDIAYNSCEYDFTIPPTPFSYGKTFIISTQRFKILSA